MNIFGYIPVRMKSTRLPGKPLKKIKKIPLLQHVFIRSKMFRQWKDLRIATCDSEIAEHCDKNKIPYVLTSKNHRGCIDRIYEAANNSKIKIRDKDIIICIQGDEPFLKPIMINKIVKSFKNNRNADSSVVTMDIISKAQYYSNSIVKIVHDTKGKILYNSRSPIPFAKKFSPNIRAKRIFGIFAFKWSYLKTYQSYGNSFLEIIESVDTNRICENNDNQYIANVNHYKCNPVDTYEDLLKAEKTMNNDPIWHKYKNIIIE